MPPASPPEVPPDWGGDTLQRFRYQAEITLPFCLAAALGLEEIASVIPEYIEDVALDCGTTRRYLQIKSRNLELGLWTLRQLMEKGGALRSLYRTHLCAQGQDHSLELILEGAAKGRDPITELKSEGDRSALVPQVAESLGIHEVQAEAFLKRVVLNAPPPPRDYIASRNRDLIHSQAPHLTKPEVDSVHMRLIHEIERAMRAERIGALWPRAIAHPERRSPEIVERLAAKTLSSDLLRTLLGSIGRSPRPILRRVVESGSTVLSPLHRKLLEGGATSEIISDARSLQANAHHERYVRESQGRVVASELLEDLHQRIETHVNARVAIHEGQARPAVLIWGDILNIFESRAASIDQNSLLRGDPMLLTGEACNLSDQCRFGWGRATSAA